MTILSVDNSEHMFETKYRPQTIAECILPKNDKEIFEQLVAKKQIPHLILQSNSPGTGKTTVAKALGRDVDAEVLFVNGSDCRIDFVRNELTSFASSRSLEGKQKIIIIDEFDRDGLAESQKHMRSFMETYSKNCSIIMTANNLDGIIEPLQSRARVIKFGVPTTEDTREMMKQMIMRLKAICENEEIELGDKGINVLAELVKQNFPDFRETVKMLDHYSGKKIIDGGLLTVVTDDRGSMQPVIDAIKAKDLGSLRAYATRYAPQYSAVIKRLVDELYPLLKIPGLITMFEIVGENNAMHGVCANAEVHMMYMFTRLVVDLREQWA